LFETAQIFGKGPSVFGMHGSLIMSPGAGLSVITNHLFTGHGPGGYNTLGDLATMGGDMDIAVHPALPESQEVESGASSPTDDDTPVAVDGDDATFTFTLEETTTKQRVVGYKVVTDVSVFWRITAYFSDEMVDCENLCNLFFAIKFVCGDITLEQYMEMSSS
jgi:hypothetical protein